MRLICSSCWQFAAIPELTCKSRLDSVPQIRLDLDSASIEFTVVRNIASVVVIIIVIVGVGAN